MRTPLATTIVLLALSAVLGGCGGDGICDADGLSAALAAAAPGDVVALGECEVTGAFTVPAGVTLRGASTTASVLHVSGGERGLTLATRSGATTSVESLAVESDGCAAIVADGPGAVSLSELEISASRGVGVAVSAVSLLTMSQVNVAGAIGDDAPLTIPMPPYTCAGADPATHGIVVAGATEARLDDVSARGFAAFGALFFESTATWTGGTVENNVGTGLEVYGGEVMLDGLSLCRSRMGVLLVESYNGIFAAGASVQSRALTVCDSESFGLMHDGVTAMHEDLSATDNAFAAVWAQGGGSLSLGGSAPVLTGNGFGGVVAFEVPAVSVAGARIEGTSARTTAAGPFTIRAGDGVHVVGADDLRLDALTLNDNERVGLLLDLEGATPTTFDVGTVTVSGAGSSLGAVAQNGDVPADWDTEVMRLGATAANDAALTEALEIVGAIGPSCLPDPSDLGAAGIDALVGR